MTLTARLRALLRRRGGSIAAPPPLGPDEARFTLGQRHREVHAPRAAQAALPGGTPPMSNVTDVFVLIGDSQDGLSEEVAPKLAEAIAEFVDGVGPEVPIISTNREDLASIQGGRKGAGGAAIWFGWNYGHPDQLVDHLKAAGFKHITVWSQHETDGCEGIPPTVTSW